MLDEERVAKVDKRPEDEEDDLGDFEVAVVCVEADSPSMIEAALTKSDV